MTAEITLKVLTEFNVLRNADGFTVNILAYVSTERPRVEFLKTFFQEYGRAT